MISSLLWKHVKASRKARGNDFSGLFWCGHCHLGTGQRSWSFRNWAAAFLMWSVNQLFNGDCECTGDRFLLIWWGKLCLTASGFFSIEVKCSQFHFWRNFFMIFFFSLSLSLLEKQNRSCFGSYGGSGPASKCRPIDSSTYMKIP